MVCIAFNSDEIVCAAIIKLVRRLEISALPHEENARLYYLNAYLCVRN